MACYILTSGRRTIRRGCYDLALRPRQCGTWEGGPMLNSANADGAREEGVAYLEDDRRDVEAGEEVWSCRGAAKERVSVVGRVCVEWRSQVDEAVERS